MTIHSAPLRTSFLLTIYYLWGDWEFLDFTTDTTYLYTYEEGNHLLFYVTAVYESCESEASNYGWIYVGIDEKKELNSIRIYPNPTNSLLNIDSEILMRKISLLDLSGRTMEIKENLNRKQHSMDVSFYNAGIYLLRIDTEEGRFVRKVVVE